MGYYDIRLPNINAPTEREQLAQLKSYIYQLAETLQYALSDVSSSTASSYVVKETTSTTATGDTKKIDEVATFNAIKALIIKSADIVDAYYEEVSRRLEGEYVASSDFGTYSEQTELTILESSTRIENLFSNVQEIITDIGNIEHSLIDVNAHIKLGEIDNVNGVPIIGIEIGQYTTIDGEEVSHKYARFTSDKLSFYDQNDNEVAYISDRKLFIENVEILSTFRIGGLKDFVLSNGDIVTKWVGIGGSG